jgi:hypothetical protein
VIVPCCAVLCRAVPCCAVPYRAVKHMERDELGEVGVGGKEEEDRYCSLPPPTHSCLLKTRNGFHTFLIITNVI